MEGCARGRFCEGGLQRDRPRRPPARAHVRPQRCVSHRDVQPGRRDQPEAEEGDVWPLRLGEEHLLLLGSPVFLLFLQSSIPLCCLPFFLLLVIDI